MLGHCYECQSSFSGLGVGHRCKCCGRLFCRNCMKVELDQPKFYKFCSHAINGHTVVSNFSSPRSSSRSDEDEDGDDSGHNFFSPRSELSQVVDSVGISTVLDLNSFKSVNSSPLDSPNRGGEIIGDQLENSQDLGYDSLLVYGIPEKPKVQKALDFENNRLIWDPPPPEDEYDDLDTGFFAYDDEDDEDVGDSGNEFSSGSFSCRSLSTKEKASDAHREQLKSAVHVHFRALVCHLLKVEGIQVGNEDGKGWLDVVSSLAWQAATFVKPDMSKGSSMDPGDYVKVKCILSGSPSDSTLVKGIVCTKNVKHKRMVSQHKNPRLFLLGEALEYQRAANKLASINTVLEQEIDHLKASVSKIEAHRPNVLLVEKSVSSYAQEYLTKEISLVLNVKKKLLERIARCTGARIAPSIDNVALARLGHCEMFRVEKFFEQCLTGSHPNKKLMKTLMFFEGCPRRLGCTVLLHGTYPEELRKVKHVVQYANFAAYHLSRETSFLADEGATVPKVPLNPQMPVPSKTLDPDTRILQSSNSTTPDADLSSCSDDAIHSFFRNNTQMIGDRSTVWEEPCELSNSPSDIRTADGVIGNTPEEGRNLKLHEEHNAADMIKREATDVENEAAEYFSTVDSQSILVSLSTTCILKGTVCEPSQLFRIKFYGSFDKPLGRYLRDDLFDQTSSCRSCKEPAESHVRCYTHHHGSLTISVRRHPSMKLPGEREGRIWMWHRCLKCEHNDGVPPAARRVVMSDAAWGLSFGKFLELSFSNHATANRIASCGHSLQKDCLRFYGSGNMVAFFRYSPVDILSVRLPPLVLDFACPSQQEWVNVETAALSSKIEFLHTQVIDVLQGFEQQITTSECDPVKTSINKYIKELKDLLKKEKNEYDAFLQPSSDNSLSFLETIDVLELNRLSRCLLIDSQMWERRLCLLDSFLKSKSSTSNLQRHAIEVAIHNDGECRKYPDNEMTIPGPHKEIDMHILECNSNNFVEMDCQSVEGYVGPEPLNLISSQYYETHTASTTCIESSSLERLPSAGSTLSDRIDSLWSGNPEANSVGSISLMDNPLYRKVISPLRVNSFDSALRLQGRCHKGLSSASLHLSSVKSFDASRNFANTLISQRSPRSKRLDFLPAHHNPVFISSTSCMVAKGARLLLPKNGNDDIVIAIYDNEPTTIISYVISSQDHDDFITSNHQFLEEGIGRPSISQFQPDEEPHFRMSFDDESSIPDDKVKFSVSCYFAKQFSDLRKKCCPTEADFLRSLSRCKRWKAQGGKSNAYFAKTLDERFIIKQVTKTELDSFEAFAPEYFKYMMESINTGSPTCLAKLLGIYQVNTRHLQGGREVKMDVMVMEYLFFGRNLSKVYDLKGSLRARYNPDTSGKDNVLLDVNLLESLGTKPIFLGSKAKRSLERAIWNDTSFLASVDVMDYSLLVGIDDERKELVVGIIDFIRQYTWDKHLETWVKASGILGGSKNESPTVVSPLQYKKRFRKAMSKYFLTVPDQWSSSPSSSFCA